MDREGGISQCRYTRQRRRKWPSRRLVCSKYIRLLDTQRWCCNATHASEDRIGAPVGCAPRNPRPGICARRSPWPVIGYAYLCHDVVSISFSCGFEGSTYVHLCDSFGRIITSYTMCAHACFLEDLRRSVYQSSLVCNYIDTNTYLGK